MKKKIADIAPGTLVCFAIAGVAWALGQNFKVVGGAVFAIVIGMLIRFFWDPPKIFAGGLKFTSKRILQYAIIFLGFEMNIIKVMETGRDSLFVMLFTFAAAFGAAFFIGKLIKINAKSATLIGVGTGICGGSAIAAAAPVIGAGSDEIAQSVSTIFLFNVIAVFVFPVFGRLLGMGDAGFGIWAGTAVNDTSSVMAVASGWSDEALKLATVVKLTRTLMIIPVTMVLAVITARGKSAGNTGNNGNSGNSGENARFRIKKVFPFFVLGFLAASLVATTGVMPPEYARALSQVGKFMIVAAMGAIGLSINIVSLVKNGKKPILLGLSCWVAVAAFTLLALAITGVK